MITAAAGGQREIRYYHSPPSRRPKPSRYQRSSRYRRVRISCYPPRGRYQRSSTPPPFDTIPRNSDFRVLRDPALVTFIHVRPSSHFDRVPSQCSLLARSRRCSSIPLAVGASLLAMNFVPRLCRNVRSALSGPTKKYTSSAPSNPTPPSPTNPSVNSSFNSSKSFACSSSYA